jgi:3-dehydroquinate synthase
VAVLANLETLRTVPEREYRSGLAEVVKAGVIWDAVLFGQIEENVDRLVARDLDVLENVVARCCQIKAEVVAMDERESGVRAILNFGHTLAHALEMSAGYGSLLHGEAVAFGMAYAARLSVEEKGLDTAAADRVVRLLAKCGLPVAVKELGLKSVPTWERLRQAMSLDKKSVGSRPRWVLAERLGAVAYGCVVPEAKLDRVFRELA